MNRQDIVISGVFYIIGLLLTSLFYFNETRLSLQLFFIYTIIVVVMITICWVFIPRISYKLPKGKTWIIAGLISLMAIIYFNIRLPFPAKDDISQWVKAINPFNSNQRIEVVGNLASELRTNRQDKQFFWFDAQELRIFERSNNSLIRKEKVSGKLYVTLPKDILENNSLYPQQKLAISGKLYQPSSPLNPSSFNFRQYLSNNGSFAGMTGEEISIAKDQVVPQWGWWKLRQRIVNAQIKGLSYPEGALLSSIILGRQAVDLPRSLQDNFIIVGLAHVLAASGFQVSLLLGVVLKLCQSLSNKQTFLLGSLVLVVYLGLTGVEPSVFRAVVMGFGVLIGVLYNRQINTLGSLFFAGIILLLVNPLWIWNLSFQLSFLATLGLVVTIPLLETKLEFIPPVISELITVPLSASVWVFPLLCYSFSVISTYSIPLNILISPLLSLISLGGMISGLLGLIYPPLGSVSAGLLHVPLLGLIQVVSFVLQLPYNTLSVGSISLGVFILLYVGIVLLHFSSLVQRYKTPVILFLLSLVVIPLFFKQVFQVTILFDKTSPVMVIEKQQEVTILQNGDDQTWRYTLVPFLADQGINRIDRIITLNDSLQTLENIRLEELANNEFSFLLKAKQTTKPPANLLTVIYPKPVTIALILEGERWLIQGESSLQKSQNIDYPESNVLLWTGKGLSDQDIAEINPKVAIATPNFISKKVDYVLKEKQAEVYITRKQGAIQWTPKKGFQRLMKDI